MLVPLTGPWSPHYASPAAGCAGCVHWSCAPTWRSSVVVPSRPVTMMAPAVDGTGGHGCFPATNTSPAPEHRAAAISPAPTGRPGRAPRVEGVGATGYAQRPALGAPPQLCSCGRSEPQQATFCWSLPDHLPLRPDAPDAQNALSGDLVRKSSMSGKMVISRRSTRQQGISQAPPRAEH